MVSAGHLLDAKENPQTVQLGAYTLFPADTLVVETEWRNSCGDNGAPHVQVGITNVGSTEAFVLWPSCATGQLGGLEPLQVSRPGGPVPTVCEETMIHTVSGQFPGARPFPHATPKEALAATLGDSAGLSGEEFGALVDLEPVDFVVVARSGQGIEYGHFEADIAVVIRVRQIGGSSSDMVTISLCS